MVRHLVFLILLLTVTLPAHAASPVKARPLSGIGVLAVKEAGKDLVLYREPGLGRLAELPAARLPGLFPQLGESSGIRHGVVLSRRPGWLRIVHDEAETPGWLERGRGIEFQPWEQFLRGKSVSMLAGLRQDYYQLRSTPSPMAETVASVGRVDLLRVRMVEGDWMRVRMGETDGWLRWRDDNSRLLIAVTGAE